MPEVMPKTKTLAAKPEPMSRPLLFFIILCEVKRFSEGLKFNPYKHLGSVLT
jgi:hypothetical protein